MGSVPPENRTSVLVCGSQMLHSYQSPATPLCCSAARDSPAWSSHGPGYIFVIILFSYLKGERKADRSRAVPDNAGMQSAQGRPRTLTGAAEGAGLSPSSPWGAGAGAGSGRAPRCQGSCQSPRPREPLGGAKVKVKRLPKPFWGWRQEPCDGREAARPHGGRTTRGGGVCG